MTTAVKLATNDRLWSIQTSLLWDKWNPLWWIYKLCSNLIWNVLIFFFLVLGSSVGIVIMFKYVPVLGEQHFLYYYGNTRKVTVFMLYSVIPDITRRVLQWTHPLPGGWRSIPTGHRVSRCGTGYKASLWHSTGLEDLGQGWGKHPYWLSVTVIPDPSHIYCCFEDYPQIFNLQLAPLEVVHCGFWSVLRIASSLFFKSDGRVLAAGCISSKYI